MAVKYRRIIIMLVFTVCVLMGIAGAWAGDADETTVAGVDAGAVSDEVLCVEDVEIIKENDDSEKIGDGGTYEELASKISNSPGPVIKLENNYTFSELIYGDGISISRSDIVIDGQGHTIDAQGLSRIFYVMGNNITIKNITFKNGNNLQMGGAIKWYGAGGSVSDCSFVNCHSGDGGGAIFWSGAGGSVSDCSFVNCHARDGGAIFWDGAGGCVSDCSFVNCSARYGGAIHLSEAAEISGCIFVNNTASDGGTVNLYCYDCAVRECIFINNTGKYAISNDWTRNDNNVISGNIFLNNNLTDDIIYFYTLGNFVVGFNWFGNTANDYSSNPDCGVDTEVWLFLNATANPDSISLSEKSNITFTLFAYNSSSYIVSEYEGIQLNSLDLLAITAVNGEVDKKQANLGESVEFTSTGAGTGIITASIDGVEYSIELEIGKADSTLSVDAMAYDYGGVGSTSVSFTGATGVEAEVVNQPDAVVKVNGNSITVSGLNHGTYTLKVTTIADDNHNPVTKTVEITVNKVNSTLSVDAMAYDYGGVGSTSVSFTGATGVEAEVVNQPDAVVKVNGNKITVSGLNPGTYTLKVTTIADANHNPVTKTVKITVNKAKAQLAANAKVFKTADKTKAYTVVLKDAKGRAITNAPVYLKVNGVTYKATTNSKGVAAFKISKLIKQGTYKATITYIGSAGYYKATKTVQITVKSVFKTVSKGSKDKAMVKKIQVALKKNGYYLKAYGHYLKVDGIFHKYTELAVKQFQKAKGLKVTGKVDETTAKKLKII